MSLSRKAYFRAGSQKPNHCEAKYMRGMVCTADIGRAPLHSQPNLTVSPIKSAYGTTRFVSSESLRVRLRLVLRCGQMSACFMLETEVDSMQQSP